MRLPITALDACTEEQLDQAFAALLSHATVGEAKIGFKIAVPNNENFHSRDIRFPGRSRPIELP
jgi:hypothetical protein